jgi:hypothetical protein
MSRANRGRLTVELPLPAQGRIDREKAVVRVLELGHPTLPGG